MSETISLVIADDHSILRQGTFKMLSSYENFNILDTVGGTEDLLRSVRHHKPDVVLSDINMPGPSVFEVMKTCQKEELPSCWLIMSMHETPDYIFQALDAGAKGYVTKYTQEEELVEALRTLGKGEEYYSQKVAQIIVKGYKVNADREAQQDPLDTLSKREREVLVLLAQGKSTKQIAEELFISERTVSNHRANMLHKTETANTVELVTRYLQSNKGWE